MFRARASRAAKTAQAIRTPPAREARARPPNSLCPSRLARAVAPHARRRAASERRGALCRSVTRCVTEVRVAASFDCKSARDFLELPSADSTNRARRRLRSRRLTPQRCEARFSSLSRKVTFSPAPSDRARAKTLVFLMKPQWHRPCRYLGVIAAQIPFGRWQSRRFRGGRRWPFGLKRAWRGAVGRAGATRRASR